MTEMIISLLALLFSLVTSIFSILSFCYVIGLKNSTHKIQYMPMPSYDNINDSQEEELKDEDKVKNEGQESKFNGGASEKLMKEMKEHMYPDMNQEFV